jgi:hypothetical protein
MTAKTATRVRVRALGGDQYKVDCDRSRCPEHRTITTSPGGLKQWAALHRVPDPDGLVAAALAEVRS